MPRRKKHAFSSRHNGGMSRQGKPTPQPPKDDFLIMRLSDYEEMCHISCFRMNREKGNRQLICFKFCSECLADEDDAPGDDEGAENWIENLTDVDEILKSFQWRPVGENYARAGTSRASYFRGKAKTASLAEAARGTKTISTFFSIPKDPSESIEFYDTTRDIDAAVEQLSAYINQNIVRQESRTKIEPWQLLQALSVCQYFEHLKAGMGKMEASFEVARTYYKSQTIWSYKGRSIRLWADYYLANYSFPVFKQGQHSKVESVIEDADIQVAFKSLLRSMNDSDRTPLAFQTKVNSLSDDDFSDDLFDVKEIKPQDISTKTAARWMKILGFFPTKASKGWFTDGHERPDVVEYREKFIADIMPKFKRMTKCETEIRPVLEDDEREFVVITHDEVTFYSNEGRQFFWLENGKKKLLPKTRGTSIMISGFMCQCHGFMSQGELKSYTFFHAGKNRDGWFTNDDLIKQFNGLVDLFKELHDGMDIHIAFDNSMTHRKIAPDGLDISSLTLNDSTKKRKVRDGWYMKDGEMITQVMNNADGTVKGKKAILEERGEFYFNDSIRTLCRICKLCKDKVTPAVRFALLGTTRCCATSVLQAQPDFSLQREWLREVVEDVGFNIIYYPKYHCELNFIEMTWGWLKMKCRQRCTYKFDELKRLLPQLIDNELPLWLIRRHARYCFRFMVGYENGLKGPLLEYAVKKYSSHRTIPSGIIASLEEEYEASLKSKKRKFYH